MKPVLLTILIAFAVGLYPGYAHRIIDAAQDVVCSIFPAQDRSVVELIIIIIAIVGVSQWRPSE